MRTRRILARTLLYLAAGGAGGQGAPGAAAPAESQAQNNVRPLARWTEFDYTCEGGAQVVVFLRGTTAKVKYRNTEYVMKQTKSADGNRYSDGKVVWWSKGKEGFLQEDAPDGNGRTMAKQCRWEQPAHQDSAVVSGTVSYLARMALPPETVVEVQLRDVSLADAAARIIAEVKITLENRQVPVPFELRFDRSKIQENHTYGLNARILVDGELRFVNDKAYLVLTAGNPSHVDMILKPVGAAEEKQP